MRRSIGLAFALSLPVLPVIAADPTEPPVAAVVESSLATDSGQIRQFALDGDPATYFASAKAPKADDHFTIVLDQPVALKSITVSTGRGDEKDKLDAGTLEASADGSAFEPIAKFSDGTARAEGSDRKVKAIRVKAAEGREAPLAIREIAIESIPSVAAFKYPVEYTVDVADAPEMQEWADKVARLCERWYPRINEELKSDGYKPRTRVNLALKKDYKGVAAAGGGRITGSVKFFTDHPDDLGAMIHETVHIVQAYRGRGNPGWLVEGVADYIRFFEYEPGKIGPINAQRAHYNGSYRVTAAFLAYLTEKYDKAIVPKLNVLMREGKYKEDVFKEWTGKTLPELDEEWRATLRP